MTASAVEVRAQKYSVILKRVLCAEGPLHSGPHPRSRREFSRRPRRLDFPPTKSAATNGRALFGTYSTFPRKWDKVKSTKVDIVKDRKLTTSLVPYQPLPRLERTLRSAASEVGLDLARCTDRCRTVEERRFQRRVKRQDQAGLQPPWSHFLARSVAGAPFLASFARSGDFRRRHSHTVFLSEAVEGLPRGKSKGTLHSHPPQTASGIPLAPHQLFTRRAQFLIPNRLFITCRGTLRRSASC